MNRGFRTFLIFGFLSLVFLVGPTSGDAQAAGQGDIVIIVNKSSRLSKISIADIKRLFLKQKTSLEGVPLTPINARINSPLRNQFSDWALGMSSTQEQSFWSDMRIKKGTRPPTELSNTVKAVFSIKNGISYCFKKDFNPAVAKILTVSQ